MTIGPLRLFAPIAGAEYGRAVAAALGEPLAPHEERSFEDGEHKMRPLASVRGADVYVVQSLHGDAAQSVDDKLVRFLFFVGALRDAGAARVTAVVPYLAYARKDRKTKPRDPVTTRYLAELLEAVGTDVVVTLDVHNLAAYQNAFRCRTEHLEAAGLFVAHLAPHLRGAEVAVVSPDAGGIKRAEALRQRLVTALERPVGAAFAEKHRSGGSVTGEALVGDVSGKVALIVDDLISTGTTLVRAARACRAAGAREVLAVATHGVFAPGADATLGDGALDAVAVTDTIAPVHPPAPALATKLTRLATAPLCAEAIRRLHGDGSLSDLSSGV